MPRPAAPLAAAAALLLAAAPALAADLWRVAPEASSVAFVSVKNGTVAESHLFAEVTGAVHPDGVADLTISLDSLDTGIEIRDTRMRALLFETPRFPLAVVYAETDPAAFADLAPGERRSIETELTVAAHGAMAAYTAELAVTRLGPDRVSVATLRPIPVQAGDFDTGWLEKYAKGR